MSNTYPFLGLVFLLVGRIHSLYNPFDAVVGGCTKDGQPQQHAHHFIPGQRPHQGLSGKIFKQHLCWLLSVHWLDKETENRGMRQTLTGRTLYSYSDTTCKKWCKHCSTLWCELSFIIYHKIDVCPHQLILADNQNTEMEVTEIKQFIKFKWII